MAKLTWMLYQHLFKSRSGRAFEQKQTWFGIVKAFLV